MHVTAVHPYARTHASLHLQIYMNRHIVFSYRRAFRRVCIFLHIYTYICTCANPISETPFFSRTHSSCLCYPCDCVH